MRNHQPKTFLELYQSLLGSLEHPQSNSIIRNISRDSWVSFYCFFDLSQGLLWFSELQVQTSQIRVSIPIIPVIWASYESSKFKECPCFSDITQLPVYITAIMICPLMPKSTSFLSSLLLGHI